jgi:hypothetical protein
MGAAWVLWRQVDDCIRSCVWAMLRGVCAGLEQLLLVFGSHRACAVLPNGWSA